MKKTKTKIPVQLPGLRNIKSVVAVFMCMLIYELWSRNAFLACITAIITLQGTVDKSFKIGSDRILATIFGGVIGVVFMCIEALCVSKYIVFITVPLGVFLIIYICSKVIKRPEFIVIACVCFLGINLGRATHSSADFVYALTRTADTLIGVLVGMFVNMFNVSMFSKNKEKSTQKIEDGNIVIDITNSKS
ncbi:MAG: aromatic acid exporter family protein [Clostridia bacterium]